MAKIDIAGRKFTYTVTRKPIISIRLSLKSRSSFSVSCPRLTPDFVITRFIKSHSDWIIKNSQKIKPKKKISTLIKLTILDQEYKVIISQSHHDSVVIFEKESQIIINSKNISTTHIKTLLESRLRRLALSIIKVHLSLLKSEFGFKYGKVSVRNQSSRFGSCSSSGNLSFNWQIILFPQKKFRHILLHELTHTLHHNHSSSFWNQLSIYDPQWHQNRNWLKKESQKYLIFS